MAQKNAGVQYAGILKYKLMSFSKPVTETLENADAKAMATVGPDGVNVVPMSMIRVNNDSIWLFNFFMDKTAKNIQTNPSVALTAWSGMTGIQVKAEVDYITEGEIFDESVEWCRGQNPDRVVKALVVLKPTEILDISPGGAFAEKDLVV